jgi:V8-like Glu-specific endopeptidase
MKALKILSTLFVLPCLLQSTGCDSSTATHDELPVVSAELDTRGGDVPPTDEEQKLEQARRARLVADLDPSKWDGWVADGEARFATVDPLNVDESRKREGLGTPEERNFGVMVLADGRRFVQKSDAYLRPATTMGEASLIDDVGDPMKGRAQIGVDDRVRVADANYSKYPYRTVGTILSKKTDKNGWCTASLIGPRLAITAGHCVYDPDTSAWSWNTWFSPGHKGEGADRFVNGTPRAVVGLVSFHGWTVNNDADHDVGFLILADEKQTASLGWLGFGWWNGSLEDLNVSMFQYPGANYKCAASPNADKRCATYQYWDTDTINNQCGNLLEHQIDTNPGSSGSPTYRWWKGQRWIVGPHAYGFSPCDSSDNKAVRLGQYKAGVGCNLAKVFPSAFATRSCG